MANSVLGSTSIGIGLYYAGTVSLPLSPSFYIFSFADTLSFSSSFFFSLVAGIGGWFGPFLMGYMRDATGDNVMGLAVLCSFLGFSIGLFSIIHVTQRTTQVTTQRRERRGKEGEERGGGGGRGRRGVVVGIVAYNYLAD